MRPRFPRPPKRVLPILLVLLTFFLVLRHVTFLEPVKMFVVSIFSPVQSRVYRAGTAVKNFATDASGRHKLAEQNRRLLDRIDELESALAGERDKRASREEQLRGLRAFLHAHQDERPEGVLAHVIGWGSANWRSSIIIDKGPAQGVQENQPVVWHDYVVGVVAKTEGTTSLVKLITDPQCRVMGRSVRSQEKCIVEGTADGRCRLKHVFDSIDIKKGDGIVTTGEHGIFPRHMLVGTVVSSEQGEVGLFRNIVVRPRMSPSKLESVLVIERLSSRTGHRTKR